ncbi:MAG: hypothetical protein DDT36_01328 [Firmicutes bacterium]|nr:hypothetical protein [candidate division NPL-UPA2 bacterium]MBT9158322.1 hypothetical protein [Bacillota bacterium]
MRKKAGRMAQIADLILERGTVRAQELADLFKTSRRTIYRDIDALQESGFQVEAYPGSNGGFRRAAQERKPTKELSTEELYALMVAGSLALENNELPYATALAAALQKLTLMLGPEQREVIIETLPYISLVAERTGDETDCNEYLDKLTQAIAHHQGVGITYYTLYRDRAELREIDPYHLYSIKGAWYVIAYCHLREQVRVFRVDRIKELNMSERCFQRLADFNVQSFFGSAWSMIKGDKYTVRVRFTPPVSRFIAESVWHPTQKIEASPDGSVIFSAEIEGLEEFQRWVLTYAEHAEVLEPTSLRDSLQRSLSKMASFYQ